MREIIIATLFIVMSGFIAIELGISTAVVEVIAGILANELISFETTEVIDLLANLGILTLMYVAGLEIDTDLLRQNLKPAFAIGSLSFALPFASVFLVSVYVLGLTQPQAVLTSIALSATSIAIIYSILKTTGLSIGRKRLILSMAMINDLLSMTMLSIFFSAISIPLIGLILGIFIFAYTFPHFERRVSRYFRGNVVEFEFRAILLLLLGVAVVSEQVGIESALIAFILGMITSEVVVRHETLAMKLRGVVFGFFAPIFFFKVGLAIRLIDLVQNLTPLVLLVTVAFASRYLGIYLGGRRYAKKMAMYVASLMNSRLSLGIIAALLGYESGVISKGLYSAIVGAIILSSLISSILCKIHQNDLPKKFISRAFQK